MEFIVKSYTVDARLCIQTWNSKKCVGTRIREVSALRLVRHDYTERCFFIATFCRSRVRYPHITVCNRSFLYFPIEESPL